MNQEQNNFNHNNFNMQGNNGIPNNHPLNNFNQNSNVNQPVINNQQLQNNQGVQQGTNNNHPIFNPQQQPTPNYQEPINQMNMQQPTQQPINTFENISNNNENITNNPQKKTKLGLIIGIVVAVIVVVIGIVFGIKLLSNNGSNNSTSSKNNVGGTNNYSFDDITKDIENVYITNYVDFQLGYSFKYPINIDLSKSRDRNYSAAVVRRKQGDNLYSVFGNDSIKTIRIDLKEELVNKSQEEILDYFIKDYLNTTPEKTNFIKEFTNNEIKWMKYQFFVGNKDDNYLYIAKYNDIKFAIVFNGVQDDEILQTKNGDAIAENIIKSVKFSNKEALLNLKEASVLMYNTVYEVENCLLYDELGNEMLDCAKIPPTIYTISGAGAIAYKKTPEININNAINKLITYSYPHRLLDVENNTYTIKKEEDVITLNESNIGDFQIKFYQLEKYSKKYNSTEILIAYVFVTNEYYGIVSNLASSENDVYQRSRLDYTMKNIVFNDKLYNPSDFVE